jgi:hypothetical protein
MRRIVEEYQNQDRTAVIFERAGVLEIDFTDDRDFLGTISYQDKSIHYVQDAAMNFISGILTPAVIQQYKKIQNT